MPRQNRVQPDGQLIATTERGLFWGNRGPLLDREGRLARYSSGRRWITCVLQFNDVRRTQWRPGRLTELFFLDEVTALAAGHRPCAACRLNACRAFQRAWTSAHPGQPTDADSIDARLHADRIIGRAVKRTYQAQLRSLPDGSMIQLDGRPWLVLDGDLLAWHPGGYRQRRSRTLDEVTVLTPRATIATLAAGYQPEVHPSARMLRP